MMIFWGIKGGILVFFLKLSLMLTCFVCKWVKHTNELWNRSSKLPHLMAAKWLQHLLCNPLRQLQLSKSRSEILCQVSDLIRCLILIVKVG